MDNLPKTVFINSPRTEKERLLMTRKTIASGFYARHGFMVVPRLMTQIDASVQVILPREREFVSSFVKDLESSWRMIENDFWREIDINFLGSKNNHQQLEIRITRYGTIASGDWLNNEGETCRVYYLRCDAKAGDLAAMIVNNLLYLEREDLGITWSKREALMDFIMTRPAMKKLFPRFRPVMSQLTRVPSSVRKQSDAYLRELGMSPPQKEFELDRLNLSKLEKKVMKLLISHRGELVTYDELADTVWGAGEFKTFWAINKLVERMRVKLNKLGIDSKRIESVRGQGYLLK